jgi:hypothetical protein
MNISYFRLKTIGFMIVLSCLLSACAMQKTPVVQQDLKDAYQKAVKDAVIAEPFEIYRNLVAIVPWNRNLAWKKDKNGQNEFLRVVTWTNYDGYDDKIGQSVKVSREIWVTTVPELQNFCREQTGDRTLRMEQLLGLPPNTGKTRLVEMWVRPDDLFRPSADSEISDREAETAFRIPNDFVKVSDDYVSWFNALKMTSYGPDGYPWTRLGYTYDWGKTGDHVGLSEFVILKGSVVEIHSVSTESQYCQ